MSGKGSAPRPFSVPRDQYYANHEAIFGKRERKQWVPPTGVKGVVLEDLPPPGTVIDEAIKAEARRIARRFMQSKKEQK